MRLFLAWAGLGKMPSDFGMLQRPTASIFGSVQFCTANSSDLFIRWSTTCLKTGTVVFPHRSQANVRRSPRPESGFSLSIPKTS